MFRLMSGRLRSPLATAAVLTVVGLAAAGCGSDDESAVAADPTPAATSSAAPGDEGDSSTTESTPEATPEPAADVATVDITVADGEISPSGEEVEVDLGEEIDFVVTADAPGEIHVHSDPEATFEYDGTGEPETFSLTIDRPGQVEVESHTLEKLIVNLVVS